MSKELNMDFARRDAIIGGKEQGIYDIYHFQGLTLEKLELLFKENFIDGDDAQDSAPTAQEILEFMRANPRFTCHGYAVTIERSDYRVSIEGVSLEEKVTEADRENFTNLFRHADEFSCSSSGCYCWFD